MRQTDRQSGEQCIRHPRHSACCLPFQMYGGAVQSEEEPSEPPAQQFEEDHNVPGLLCRWALPGDGRMWAPALSEGVGPPGRRRDPDCGVCGSQVRDQLRRKYALIVTSMWTTRGRIPVMHLWLIIRPLC